jgi:hypothetical protein
MKTAFQHQRNKHLVQSVFEELLFYYEADYLTHLEWANQSRSIFLALGMLGKKSCRFIIDFSKSACQFKLMKTDFQHQRNKHLVQSVFEKLLFYYEADSLTNSEWAYGFKEWVQRNWKTIFLLINDSLKFYLRIHFIIFKLNLWSWMFTGELVHYVYIIYLLYLILIFLASAFSHQSWPLKTPGFHFDLFLGHLSMDQSSL